MTPFDEGWQAGLAAEHRAVFGYAVLGPRLDSADRSLAVTCSDAHEVLRNDTEAAMVTAGLTPVATRADYPSVYPVTDPTSARALAVRLEDSCASAWRYLYAKAADATGTAARARRREAQEALTASALRATRWRKLTDPNHATSAFPGI